MRYGTFFSLIASTRGQMECASYHIQAWPRGAYRICSYLSQGISEPDRRPLRRVYKLSADDDRGAFFSTKPKGQDSKEILSQIFLSPCPVSSQRLTKGLPYQRPGTLQFLSELCSQLKDVKHLQRIPLKLCQEITIQIYFVQIFVISDWRISIHISILSISVASENNVNKQQLQLPYIQTVWLFHPWLYILRTYRYLAQSLNQQADHTYDLAGTGRKASRQPHKGTTPPQGQRPSPC